MKLLLILLLGLAQQPADTTRTIGVAPDTAGQGHAALDSLYAARDTTALVRALRAWKGASDARVELYRGVSAAWTGRATQAVGILRPLVDTAGSRLTVSERRDAIRALAESYSRKREYSSAAALYDGELLALDAAVDSANARAAAVKTDTVVVMPDSLLDVLTSPQAAPPESAEKIPGQVGLIGLLFALFLVPKALQRFRIPGAITSLLMGLGASALGWLPNDVTLRLFSTLGIVSLFLFAGLEIDGHELRRNAKPLVLHAVIWTVLAIATALGAAAIFGLSARAAALLSLALVTPSTGFILSSLSSFGLSGDEQKTVRTYAIGSELIALTALFFILQSTSVQHLALALAAMAGVVVLIPLAFRGFAVLVAPYAPRSEFAFLLMVGVACAYATRLLGVYYLVGAFLVGVAAQRFRGSHPAMSSEKMIDALESFGSVFIPFYFFHAGTEIHPEHISWRAFLVGMLLVGTFVPLRVAVIGLHRRLALAERFAIARRVGSAMVPTLVFTLVILGILTEQYPLPSVMAGALVFYTIVNTTLPAFILKARPASFEEVSALPLDREPAEG
ncbi:MAG: cation:proton antiporter [Gemmatimonadetes bacterium]|nr:cation:proton antiporter [Gemmatimonadota bacterium]